MDCGESGDGLGAIKEGDDTLMDAVELSGYHPTEVTSSKTEPSKQSEEGDESAGLNAIEDGDIDCIAVGSDPATTATEKNLEEEQGVTPEPAEPSFTRLGQLGVPAMTERFEKMVTGPKPNV